MSRHTESKLRHTQSFPRVSGDEPSHIAGQSVSAGFSPRERG